MSIRRHWLCSFSGTPLFNTAQGGLPAGHYAEVKDGGAVVHFWIHNPNDNRFPLYVDPDYDISGMTKRRVVGVRHFDQVAVVEFAGGPQDDLLRDKWIASILFPEFRWVRFTVATAGRMGFQDWFQLWPNERPLDPAVTEAAGVSIVSETINYREITAAEYASRGAENTAPSDTQTGDN